MTDNIALDSERLLAFTQGQVELFGYDFEVAVANAALLPEAVVYLETVLAYLNTSGKRIHSGETMSYGYWLTRFEKVRDKCLTIWEHNREATAFVPGADLTLTYWRDQHAICAAAGAAFTPPRPNQLVVVSDGVQEGDSVQRVRYPCPVHMSGWWITTDRYDGNAATLRTEHLYHVTAARSELAKFVSLPFGFRFDTATDENPWFDSEAAS